MQSVSPARSPRQTWMAVLARADAATLRESLAKAPALPAYTVLRGPELGLVMAQGRAGGGGAAFNLGEMTVVRCTVRTADGLTGHATVAGRSTEQAELAAVLDAALQNPERQADLLAAVVDPLAQAQAERRTANAERAAATRVQFFTMATMR
ncbi:MAG: phosphonate C-P lyase system protein PhnG [Acetobacteraceae bacterium]